MRNRLVVILTLLSGLSFIDAQVLLEGQVGGANFLGFSFNTCVELPLSKNGEHAIVPSIGMGFMVPPLYKGTGLMRGGLEYKYKGWGLGAEAAGFFANPFSAQYGNDFVDLLVYPNISHTVAGKGNWYFRLSVGLYLAYSRYYNYYSNEPGYLQFEGDVIPGASLAIGYKFVRCETKPQPR